MSSTLMVLTYVCDDFNSLMVRLDAINGDTVNHLVLIFQFLNGAIGWMLLYWHPFIRNLISIP